MKVSFQNFEHITVFRISGEFTADDVDQFKRMLEERFNSGMRDVLVDCEHLEFVDSAALELLIELQQRVGVTGGQLRLIQPDDSIRLILELTRLDVVLESHASLEAAVRSVR